ncbi:hypothetical protein [Cupriavidus sp. UYPR2.512]|uniref:hypothetical protein n=1 Tax=Cupriavidus sp. UYPR2.512 TaxID=1080187 RepID=UPI0003A51AE7|nr:hypothetical protein [Cupriavidus sp. UYPR2.512]UIF88725.1 hypothetical protein KAF44_25855 [Cupriavidus necator]
MDLKTGRLAPKVRRTKDAADAAAVDRVRALFARPEMSVEALKKRAEIAKNWEQANGMGGAYAGVRR